MWKITLDCLPPSLNQFYAGMHWSKRKRIVDEWHGLFREAFQRARIPRKIESLPISLRIVQLCKGTVRDCDNGVVAAKLAGDSLRIFGHIPDDTPEYINAVYLHSTKARENGLEIYVLTEGK